MINQFIYRIIYYPAINYILRSINKALSIGPLKRIKLPPSGKINLRVNQNKLFIHTNQTSYLTQLLFWKGYNEFEYTQIFLELIKVSGVFIDIGANIGYYSLLAAAVNQKAKIISFEPATGPCYYLTKNVSRNNFQNITVEAVALSNFIGNIEFYEVQNQKYTYLKYNLSGEGNAGSITEGRNFKRIIVPTITLDEYANKHNVKNIDLIKMDTEGTENTILIGASEVITKYRPIIICETIFNAIEKDLETIMLTHGYEFYNHCPEGLKKVTTIQRTIDDGVSNCFFVPKEKTGLIQKFIRS